MTGTDKSKHSLEVCLADCTCSLSYGKILFCRAFAGPYRQKTFVAFSLEVLIFFFRFSSLEDWCSVSQVELPEKEEVYLLRQRHQSLGFTLRNWWLTLQGVSQEMLVLTFEGAIAIRRRISRRIKLHSKFQLMPWSLLIRSNVLVKHKQRLVECGYSRSLLRFAEPFRDFKITALYFDITTISESVGEDLYVAVSRSTSIHIKSSSYNNKLTFTMPYKCTSIWWN